MALYDDVKNAIQQKYYSLLDAQGILNAFLGQLQITAEQYDELMELADKLLNPNNADDEENIEKGIGFDTGIGYGIVLDGLRFRLGLRLLRQRRKRRLR